MENINEKLESKADKAEPVKTNWWVVYVIVGVFFYFYKQSYGGTTIKDFIALIASVAVGLYFYPLKAKLKIKNKAGAGIVALLILLLVSAILTAFLTSLATYFKI